MSMVVNSTKVGMKTPSLQQKNGKFEWQTLVNKFTFFSQFAVIDNLVLAIAIENFANVLERIDNHHLGVFLHEFL